MKRILCIFKHDWELVTRIGPGTYRYFCRRCYIVKNKYKRKKLEWVEDLFSKYRFLKLAVWLAVADVVIWVILYITLVILSRPVTHYFTLPSWEFINYGMG